MKIILTIKFIDKFAVFSSVSVIVSKKSKAIKEVSQNHFWDISLFNTSIITVPIHQSPQ